MIHPPEGAEEGGGMEYPMMIFCGARRDERGLYGVTTHEIGHNWFPMTVNTDERRHAWMDEGFNSFITLSLYQLTQKNVLTPDTDPTHVGFFTQTGEIRSRGVELEGKLSITNQLDMIGSYTYTDATVTQSNDVDLNKTPLGIPRNTAALWGDYTIRGGMFNGLGFASGVLLELPIIHLYQDTWAFSQAVEYMAAAGFMISQLSPVSFDSKDDVSLVEVDCLFRRDR